MIPGMYHCQGGPGTDTFDKAATLDAWVTTGKGARPHRRVASHRRQSRSHASRVRVPEGRQVERSRQHRRRAELRVRADILPPRERNKALR